ncbi:MAG: ABC-F family ATP-binding cassette domain-containing protein [Thermoplasmatales archaeon]|nr:ABC-F family ATP-binding cassette domain-containing protein [Thermoplasmatales archaeon]
MLIRAESVTKSFGPVKVLTKADLQINRGDSIGLIGVNGAGKSTFLKILLGEERCDTGEIIRNTERIGYLPQFADSSEDTVRDVLGRSYGHLEHIRRRMRELDSVMSSGEDIDWNSVTSEYAVLESELSGSKAEDEKTQLAALKKVGLPQEFMDRSMCTLSGGERTKVMLSRIVIQAEGCDVLFLDEPTSHLDIDTVEWLEDFLLNAHVATVIISHDRYFLDKVATRVCEISNGKTREYKGNYSSFLEKKMLDLERMEKEYRKYTIQKKRQEEIAAEMHRDQWFSAVHKTRLRMADRLEEKEAPETMKNITVRIQSAPKSGKNVITTKDLTVDLGGRRIIDEFSADVHKGEKIGIFGANGQGKSTLVKALLEKIPSGGELWIAPGAKIGYFDQNHGDLIPSFTAEEQLMHVIGKERRGEARQLLARMLLTDEKVEKPISTLSGGERARVAMAVLLLKETNLLILDEPTNYLDIPSRHAIEDALEEYDGTIISVTHDRYFLDTVCNMVWEVKDGDVTTYAGTYSSMKGRPNVREIVIDADEYRVTAPFTNWVTNRKLAKGDRVLVAPSEMKSYEWAIEQGKMRRTGGRQRKKISVETP